MAKASVEPTPVCVHHQNTTGVQKQQSMQCLARLPTEQLLLLKRVETSTAVSSCLNISRRVGEIISTAGRKLEGMLTTPPEVVLHKKAERDLQEAKKKRSKQSKILLLGCADSGKSDLLKRMRMMQREPYSLQERETFRRQVFRRLTLEMLRILCELDDFGLSLSSDNQHNAEVVQNAHDLSDEEPFPALLCHALSSLWEDPSVQAIRRDRETREIYGFPASLSYFFSSLDRLCDVANMPTEQDILNFKFQTTGVIETTLRYPDGDVIIVDPDRCRGERRKWLHHFADVDCVLFVVNLSGYDEHPFEDRYANRMQESLWAWDSICHSVWFRQTSLMLFLNKYDLFERKIKTSHIKDYFPDYGGSIGDAAEGVLYFKKRFRRVAAKNRRRDREVYIHITTSTDTGIMRVLLSALDDIRQNRNLEFARLI